MCVEDLRSTRYESNTRTIEPRNGGSPPCCKLVLIGYEQENEERIDKDTVGWILDGDVGNDFGSLSVRVGPGGRDFAYRYLCSNGTLIR